MAVGASGETIADWLTASTDRGTINDDLLQQIARVWHSIDERQNLGLVDGHVGFGETMQIESRLVGPVLDE